MNWLTDTKIPVGAQAKTLVDWMNANLSSAFDALSTVMGTLIGWLLAVLQWPPNTTPFSGSYTPLYNPDWHPVVIIAGLTALTWVMQRNWKTCLLVVLGFGFIINQGYWKATTETLTLILSAAAICMAIGVPIGIAAAHRPKLYRLIAPMLDLMQTLPTFVYLIPAIIFFGLGMTSGLMATLIFVLPVPIRMTYLGISSTPAALTEAATAFGATPAQKLRKVELPWALPQIMVGLNQTIMLSLSMVVLATLVGAKGLGAPVMRAFNSVNTALGFEAGLVIVVLAIVLDRMLRISR